METDENENLDIENSTSEKLCDIIIANRYLKVFKDLVSPCMLELAKRRKAGSDFLFENYIDEKLSEMPKFSFKDMKKEFLNFNNFQEIFEKHIDNEPNK